MSAFIQGMNTAIKTFICVFIALLFVVSMLLLTHVAGAVGHTRARIMRTHFEQTLCASLDKGIILKSDSHCGVECFPR